jgi:hypothetical protein
MQQLDASGPYLFIAAHKYQTPADTLKGDIVNLTCKEENKLIKHGYSDISSVV